MSAASTVQSTTIPVPAQSIALIPLLPQSITTMLPIPQSVASLTTPRTIKLASLFNQFLCHATTAQAPTLIDGNVDTQTTTINPTNCSKICYQYTSILCQLSKLCLPSTPYRTSPDSASYAYFASSASSANPTSSANSASSTHFANPAQQPTVCSPATTNSSVYPAATANTQR